MAFRISLSLQSKDFSGIEAIEESRRVGVSEETELSYFDRGGPGFDVSEAFARRWFGPSQTDSTATVPVSLLQPGDVERMDGNPRAVSLRELPPARIIELYESARIRGLMEENDRLQSELEELRQPTDAEVTEDE